MPHASSHDSSFDVLLQRELVDHLPAGLTGAPSFPGLLAQIREALAATLAPPVELVAPRLVRRLSVDSTGELGLLAVGDLVLSLGAVAGHAPSVAQVDALVVEQARRVVKGSADEALELAQAVRVRVLLPTPGRHARLADYAGQGSLAAWLRVVSVRALFNLRRGPGGRELPVDQLPEPTLGDADPEVALLRARHRAHFREAFAQAVSALTPRERTLLRLHTLDGLTLARLGAMYGRDASTISRWLDAARDTLLARTRAQLAETLGLDAAELDSVMRLADGELSVSLGRLLSPSAEPSLG